MLLYRFRSCLDTDQIAVINFDDPRVAAIYQLSILYLRISRTELINAVTKSRFGDLRPKYFVRFSLLRFCFMQRASFDCRIPIRPCRRPVEQSTTHRQPAAVHRRLELHYGGPRALVNPILALNIDCSRCLDSECGKSNDARWRP